MTNISKEVWIENLEKLPDGTYKRKNPITKVRDEGQNPDWNDAIYRLVMIDGEPFMEVVAI